MTYLDLADELGRLYCEITAFETNLHSIRKDDEKVQRLLGICRKIEKEFELGDKAEIVSRQTSERSEE